MNFEYTDKVKELMRRIDEFMQEHLFPVEEAFDNFVHDPANLWVVPPVLEELKQKAKAAGLWNYFLPREYGEFSPGLSNLEYAPLAELMGRIEWASEVFNCSAPDTGNMEVLARYGSPEQQEIWLKPLLAGDIRSAYLMTEPQNACSDATNVACSIVREGDEYVINGRKWWASCVYDPRCTLLLVMGKTDPDAPKYNQQSTIIVAKDTPGVNIIRPLKVFGEIHSPFGHGEVQFDNVRVPVGNMILGEGRGFEIAQGRLGPGRIHHCMRLIGAAQRCLDIMCKRVDSRVAFGRKLADQGMIRKDVAQSRCDIEQARLLTLAAADKLDKFGNKVARDYIAMIKVVAPGMCQEVADRALQAHGSMGLSQDTPIANLFAYARSIRLADGPDEAHMSQLGKLTIEDALKKQDEANRSAEVLLTETTTS